MLFACFVVTFCLRDREMKRKREKDVWRNCWLEWFCGNKLFHSNSHNYLVIKLPLSNPSAIAFLRWEVFFCVAASANRDACLHCIIKGMSLWNALESYPSFDQLIFSLLLLSFEISVSLFVIKILSWNHNLFCSGEIIRQRQASW